MKLAVYTAIADGYDTLKAPRIKIPGVDYYCFTEPCSIVAEAWSRRDLAPEIDQSAATRNRYAKMLPHLLLPDYDASIYVDGNIEVLGNVMELARRALAFGNVALYDHPVRIDPYSEAIECARIGFDWNRRIRVQMDRYRRAGMPRNVGLLEANIIIRAHNTERVIRAMESWWREWQDGVKRDQLSLMYVLWKENVSVCRLGRHDARFINQYFAYGAHQRKPSRSPARWMRKIANRIDLAIHGI